MILILTYTLNADFDIFIEFHIWVEVSIFIVISAIFSPDKYYTSRIEIPFKYFNFITFGANLLAKDSVLVFIYSTSILLVFNSNIFLKLRSILHRIWFFSGAFKNLYNDEAIFGQ